MPAAALLEDAPKGARWLLAGVAAAVTGAATARFRQLGRELAATGGPGYDRFQRAGSADAVRQARAEWGPDGLAAAREAWTLDLVYPPAYGVLGALLASLAATRASSRHQEGLAATMRIVSRLSLAAGTVDLAVENPAVAVGLWAEPSDGAARLAARAGSVKRLLLGLTLGGLAAFFLALLARRA